MITVHTDSVSLPVLQLLHSQPSTGPPGHLVSPAQPSPAGARSPHSTPWAQTYTHTHTQTPGPSHPLIHLLDISSFILPLPFFAFISPFSSHSVYTVLFFSEAETMNRMSIFCSVPFSPKVFIV